MSCTKWTTMHHSDIDKTWLLSRLPCRQEKKRSGKNERNLKSALPRGCDLRQVTIACYTRQVMSRLPRSRRKRKAFEVGSFWCLKEHGPAWSDCWLSKRDRATSDPAPLQVERNVRSGSRGRGRSYIMLKWFEVYFKQTAASPLYGFWHFDHFQASSFDSRVRKFAYFYQCRVDFSRIIAA